MKSMLPDASDRKALRTFFLTAIAWLVAVITIALLDAYSPFRLPAPGLSFAQTGQFGDSFGTLSAFMAATAAFFAYRTYASAQQELETLKRRSGEPTFLGLLDRRLDLLGLLRWGQTKGHEVLIRMATDTRAGVRDQKQDPAQLYSDLMKDDSVHGLRNLFRFTYHAVTFAETLFGADKGAAGAAKRQNGAYPYARLLRAQMSDEDLLMMALNSRYDPKAAGMQALIERYALLHNMPEDDILLFGFKTFFHEDAFGIPERDESR